jgi:hypothetical protein
MGEAVRRMFVGADIARIFEYRREALAAALDPGRTEDRRRS